MNSSNKAKRARVPKIGSAVRGSTSGRPIMAALDLLGRRTALRILWELRERSLTFRALQEACETSPGLLNTRLKELRESGIVGRSDEGYCLTTQGRKLRAALDPLNIWAQLWAAENSGKRSTRLKD